MFDYLAFLAFIKNNWNILKITVINMRNFAGSKFSRSLLDITNGLQVRVFIFSKEVEYLFEFEGTRRNVASDNYSR